MVLAVTSFPERTAKMETVLTSSDEDRQAFRNTHTHLVMLNKVHKRSPLHLHRLAVSVVEGQDKVEEVGLAEIRGRLLLKMSS